MEKLTKEQALQILQNYAGDKFIFPVYDQVICQKESRTGQNVVLTEYTFRFCLCVAYGLTEFQP